MSSESNPYQSPLAPPSTSNDARRSESAKKARSVFWVVSTHILTTSIVSFFASLLAVYLVARLQLFESLSPNLTLFASLAIAAGGYVVGTYYSLSYLRKATAIRDPETCTKASVIVFVLLAILWLGVEVVVFRLTDPVALLCWIVFYVTICWTFARITRTGFQNMAALSTDA